MKITIDYGAARGYVEIYGQRTDIKGYASSIQVTMRLVNQGLMSVDEAIELARSIEAVANAVRK